MIHCQETSLESSWSLIGSNTSNDPCQVRFKAYSNGMTESHMFVSAQQTTAILSIVV